MNRYANPVPKTRSLITPTSGVFMKLSARQRDKALVIVKEMRWFLREGSDLSAYRMLFPAHGGKSRKSPDFVVAIWSKFNSKERALLKKVGEWLKTHPHDHVEQSR